MVCLPTLVLGAKVECARVLNVRRQYDGLVTRLAGKLDTEVPRIEGDECELEVLGGDVFLVEIGEAVDCVTEGTCVADLVPGEGG